MKEKEPEIMKEKGHEELSALIPGLTPVDPQAIESFKDEMNQRVIPEILKVVEERRLLAEESRQMQIKC
jgi:hypothetical protein